MLERGVESLRIVYVAASLDHPLYCRDIISSLAHGVGDQRVRHTNVYAVDGVAADLYSDGSYVAQPLQKPSHAPERRLLEGERTLMAEACEETYQGLHSHDDFRSVNWQEECVSCASKGHFGYSVV